MSATLENMAEIANDMFRHVKEGRKNENGIVLIFPKIKKVIIGETFDDVQRQRLELAEQGIDVGPPFTFYLLGDSTPP